MNVFDKKHWKQKPFPLSFLYDNVASIVIVLSDFQANNAL